MKTLEIDVSALPPQGLRRLTDFVCGLGHDFAIELPHRVIDLSGYTCDFDEIVWPPNTPNGDSHVE